MITRSQKRKVNTEEQTAEEEYLESKIDKVVKSMREFGIQNCCKCGKELEHNHYAARSSHKGYKYYCIPCDDRRW